jgi:hypothetical protein
MTNRERLCAILHGRPLDRVPFAAYNGLVAPSPEIWDLLGRDRFAVIRWSAAYRLETPNCRVEEMRTERDGRTVVVVTMRTPAGTLVQERHHDPVSGAYFPVRSFVNTKDDYAALAAYIRDTEVIEDFDHYRKDEAELGDDGLAMAKLERTPWQQLWIRWTGLENLCVHVADFPDAVEECLSLWADVWRRIARVTVKAVESAGVQYVNAPDNITASVIGRTLFDRWCVPLYREAAGMLEPYRLPLIGHFDGELGPLRESIAGCGVGGIDSFTPQPDTANRLGDCIDAWPGMRFFVNFPSSLHHFPPETVYAAAMELLEQGGHTGRLALQISEDIPPDRWQATFPAIVRAIDDFGRP